MDDWGWDATGDWSADWSSTPDTGPGSGQDWAAHTDSHGNWGQPSPAPPTGATRRASPEEHASSVAGQPGPAPGPRRFGTHALVAVALLSGIAIGIGPGHALLNREPSEGVSAVEDSTDATRYRSAEPTPTPSPSTILATPSISPPAIASPAPSGASPTIAGIPAEVTWVADGDTVEIADGRRVRLIGIDTPERGQCGYEEASRRLESLVLNRSVTLEAGSGDSTDRYGRLLRYVVVDGVDAGEVLLREGLAVPRYNSTDGYGWHPKEDRYAQVAAAPVCS